MGSMKPFLSAVLVIVLAGCDVTAPRTVQSRVDDSRVPADLRAAYLEDASLLALRELIAGGFHDIRIPADTVQPYYDALVLVYNATLLPARDTVVDVYRIHTFGQPSIRRLYLLVPDTQQWAQRLAHDSLPTGNAGIDQLLAEYGMSYDHAFVMSSTQEFLIVLRSTEPLNMPALASRFAEIPGVRAGQDGLLGDGNNITGTRDDVLLLDYSVGYGDCPAGCTARRVYHFGVHSDGRVDYLGASGSPPPQPGQP